MKYIISNLRKLSLLQRILVTTLIVGTTLYVYIQYMNQEVERKIKTLPLHNINNLCDANKTYKEHTKVLSYCVFGTNPKYMLGIPKVIEMKRNSSFYKDWFVRVYHHGNIPKDMLEKIEGSEDVQLCNAHNIPHYGDLSKVLGLFWRFLAMADLSVDVFCSRDLDSDILLREEDAMKEFMDSDAVIHTMRDNPSHTVPLLAGMWCYKNKLNRVGGKYYLEKMLEEEKRLKPKEEQRVLSRIVWRHATKMQESGMGEIMQHDSYLCKNFGNNARPFPKQRRPNDYFVGRPRSEGSNASSETKKRLVCPVECRPSYGKDWANC